MNDTKTEILHTHKLIAHVERSVAYTQSIIQYFKFKDFTLFQDYDFRFADMRKIHFEKEDNIFNIEFIVNIVGPFEDKYVAIPLYVYLNVTPDGKLEITKINKLTTAVGSQFTNADHLKNLSLEFYNEFKDVLQASILDHISIEVITKF